MTFFIFLFLCASWSDFDPFHFNFFELFECQVPQPRISFQCWLDAFFQTIRGSFFCFVTCLSFLFWTFVGKKTIVWTVSVFCDFDHHRASNTRLFHSNHKQTTSSSKFAFNTYTLCCLARQHSVMKPKVCACCAMCVPLLCSCLNLTRASLLLLLTSRRVLLQQNVNVGNWSPQETETLCKIHTKNDSKTWTFHVSGMFSITTANLRTHPKLRAVPNVVKERLNL